MAIRLDAQIENGQIVALAYADGDVALPTPVDVTPSEATTVPAPVAPVVLAAVGAAGVLLVCRPGRGQSASRSRGALISQLQQLHTNATTIALLQHSETRSMAKRLADNHRSTSGPVLETARPVCKTTSRFRPQQRVPSKTLFSHSRAETEPGAFTVACSRRQIRESARSSPLSGYPMARSELVMHASLEG